MSCPVASGDKRIRDPGPSGLGVSILRARASAFERGAAHSSGCELRFAEHVFVFLICHLSVDCFSLSTSITRMTAGRVTVAWCQRCTAG